MADYRYELRRGEQVVATGHVSSEEPFAVGDPITIAGEVGVVRSIDPVLGEHELHLVVQLHRDARS
jgi:hypothetical protein